MSDEWKQPIPTRTLNDPDFYTRTRTFDATDATRGQTVDQNGNAKVKINGLYDASTNPTPSNVGVIARLRNVTQQIQDQTQALTSLAMSGGRIALDVYNNRDLTAATDSVTANQGLPNTIANAWPVKITDGTDNTIVKVVKEEQHYDTGDHGIPIYGVDRSVNPKKYHAMRVDSNGIVSTHLTNDAGLTNRFDAGLSDDRTVRTASNVYGFDGTNLRQLLTDTVGRQIMQITGGDGLYKATVDSLNRLSVNANVQFPEAEYQIVNVLNAGSKTMNVNGTLGAPVNFLFTPAGQTFYLETLSIFLSDNANFSPTGFGAIAALTNGILVEYQSKGVLYTLCTIRDNADIFNVFSEPNFSQSIAGLLSTAAYLTGNRKLQQRIALDPAFGDFVRVRVRDNLTGLTALSMRVSAWRVN